MSLKRLFLVIFLLVNAAESLKPAFAQLASCIPVYTPGCTVTLSWQDNSGNDPKVNDQETEFVIWRNLNGGAFAPLGKPVGPNVTTVIDATTIAQSATVDNLYCYEVAAANWSSAVPSVRQQSAFTTPACFTVPKSPVVIVIPGAPSNALLK